ncbi:E3 ubiquitin-protein ligase ATL9 [Brachypodium distachyon]|uniref:RING-type E3 ubiquitin transferase n=1 Tax=Brachypodium distachyon TaxID=15368 RepID=A0A2K2DAP2_BRADI|nr:E3 ubiquitin-protein ligase ATL9 [Brachypodium distachyon]PNT71338.1 hypothetical protein BRADI_2g26370v3 [Brachypodium distachyon]|eukprot:XP_010231427.1 E3 ubiquitin-protein ligase ATL9 [Brachypodium distachyon]
MLNLYPRLALAASGTFSVDEDEPQICYGIMVAFVSLLLFCVLVAVVSVARACSITGLIVLLFGLVGWFGPRGGAAAVAAARRNGTRQRQQQPSVASAAPAPTAVRLAHRCTCGMTDAAIGTLPTFAYEATGDEGARQSCLLCAVCLEDVQAGQTVRELPPCRHLFHVDCIDLWLQTHRTCPLCRCELPLPPPRKATSKAAAAGTETESSTNASLPPV